MAAATTVAAKRAIALLTAVVFLGGCEDAPTTVDAIIGGIPQGWVGFPDSSRQVGLTHPVTTGDHGT